MYTYYNYEALCHQCGDLSLMQADEKGMHIQAAKSHHESTGHTCQVSEETTSVALKGRRTEIVSYDSRVITVFDKRINQPG